MFIDRCFQLAYKLAYRLIHVYWFICRPSHRGALVAIWHPLKGQCQEDTPLLTQKTYLVCIVLTMMNLPPLF